MSDALAAAADKILEAALAETGARDPRDVYRERLRELKRVSVEDYQRAVTYYTETLIPNVAEGRREPLAAWTEYGQRLAESLAPGRTVSIDETGRAHPYRGPAASALILHLPEDKGARAILVALPPSPSVPQRATYDVLVSGRQRLSDEDSFQTSAG
jgi:hypothetical protein